MLDRTEGLWRDGFLPTRDVTFTLPMNNPLLKLKEIQINETQHILISEDYL
jgi:hypothetical protein